jgi:uncharacterized protein
MQLEFINRQAELKELDAAFAAGGLLVLFGRRRIGKTRLLNHWLNDPRSGSKRDIRMYSQAIEAGTPIQIEQVFNDIKGNLDTALTPRTWAELFEIVSLAKEPFVLCIDEFQYLVASDKSLPSVLQRWIDHKLPQKALLILAGSSTRMMHDLVLNRSAPLYGRARKILSVRPMGYRAFCQACNWIGPLSIPSPSSPWLAGYRNTGSSSDQKPPVYNLLKNSSLAFLLTWTGSRPGS